MQQSQIFDDDLRESKPISYEQWKHRPALERLMEGVARLFDPLL